MLRTYCKHYFFTFLTLLFIFTLSGCSHPESANQIRIGTISGPETELMQEAQKSAKQDNLDIKIVEFNDYTIPNQALQDGSIDINMFQTLPYLKTDMKAHDYKFVVVGKSFVYPMAIYSQKIKTIKNLQPKSLVAVPNDPSNEGRALLLLQKAKLIKLAKKANLLYTVQDIKKNPFNLEIKEIDAAQLPRALADVTLAVINTNYAVPAGLYPNKDGLFSESKNSDYVNVFVVKSGFEHDPRVEKLLKAFQNQNVVNKANELFKGQAIAAW